MHNVGLIIWLIIVAFGVISSIRKNVQRAQAQRAAAPQAAVQPSQPRPQPPQPQPAPPRLVTTAFAMPPVDPPPPPRPVPAPKPKPLAPQVPLTLAPEHPRIGTSPIRGMFGGSATLVRAIVAAEVLGQPKAFQEQTIWSPRHSEPSI
jgi:hypothetical protein